MQKVIVARSSWTITWKSSRTSFAAGRAPSDDPITAFPRINRRKSRRFMRIKSPNGGQLDSLPGGYVDANPFKTTSCKADRPSSGSYLQTRITNWAFRRFHVIWLSFHPKTRNTQNPRIAESSPGQISYSTSMWTYLDLDVQDANAAYVRQFRVLI